MTLDRLEVGFLLDRQWHALRGEMDTSKRPALVTLARVLEESRTPYAIIGGVALQIHQAEPRTTLDIDLAVRSFDALPRQALEETGFSIGGRFAHSENWVGPEGVPVQFTDDPLLGPAVDRAIEIELDDVRLRVIGRSDLLHEKLRADPRVVNRERCNVRYLPEVPLPPALQVTSERAAAASADSIACRIALWSAWPTSAMPTA